MKQKHFTRFILAAILFISVSYTANSQVLISLLLGDKLNSDKLKFGLDGGVNWSNISNIAPSMYKAHFNLGFYFDFLLKENTRWYLHTGVLVKSSMGGQGMDPYTLGNADLDSLFVGGKMSRKISYFNVPILARYQFKNMLYIEAGPNLGLRYKAYDIFYADVEDKKDLSYSLDVRDQFTRIDAGIMAGIGFQVLKGTGYNFGMRYYQGLTEIMKVNAGDPQHNSTYYLYFSMPVGAGAKAKAKAEAKKLEKEAKKANKK
jgi:Outer membrane protein beta-barrel domain